MLCDVSVLKTERRQVTVGLTVPVFIMPDFEFFSLVSVGLIAAGLHRGRQQLVGALARSS
ncbi:hypothetical protein O9993_00465 [Vibrio lentus]|nr:hypothetical protein [Vibrio lentus]